MILRKRKSKIGDLFLKIKSEIFKIIQTFLSNKKLYKNQKPIPKYILYEDEKNKKRYLLVLRTNEGDDFELHRIKGIANSNKYDPFIIEDTEVKDIYLSSIKKFQNKLFKLLNKH